MEHESGPPETPEEVAGGDSVAGAAEPGSPQALVDEAIAGLDDLPGRPLAEHVAAFEEAHAKLRQVLSDLDDGPADS